MQEELWAALDKVEKKLSTSRFLVSNSLITEADVRLFPTIIRFDAVYSTLFKCSKKSIRTHYPCIEEWMRDVYQLLDDPPPPPPPFRRLLRVRDTIDVDKARSNYYSQLFPLNPSGIIPSGPTLLDLELDRPTRWRKGKE